MEIGDAVQAVKAVVDCSTGLSHAEPGDVGTVVAIYPDAIGPTVTWAKTGTTYDVAEEEVRFLRHFDEPKPADEMEVTGRWVWAPCVACDGIGQVLETTTIDGSYLTEAVVTCPACGGIKKHLVRL